MAKIPDKHILLDIYNRLLSKYGAQHWWPGDSPFEVIIGAILTQSAAWTNVERAINNLKSADALSTQAIMTLSLEQLAKLIRPSGYYNAKALKLKAFVQWLDENYRNDLKIISTVETNALRNQMLAVYGIGNETADSILLYALDRPVFVIDAYTRRIISRISLLSEDNTYDEYQQYFMKHLPVDLKLFNEYHALLVRLGKNACRKKPLCGDCCLTDICRLYIGSG
ncbi:MAG: endonuclease III domain-containing protein [Dehalococcoidales bacterium]|nr:endonuclease III domain-containing protein [Dehalococcoidales bacterium]